MYMYVNFINLHILMLSLSVWKRMLCVNFINLHVLMLSLSVWKRMLCVNFIDLLITYVEPVGVEADVVC